MTTLVSQVTALASRIATECKSIRGALTGKADLVSGKVPLSQLALGLGDLTNTPTTASDGNALVYNATTARWIASAIVGTPGAAGTAGADGTKWYSGGGSPASGLGNVGDYYMQTNGSVHKKTTATTWVYQFSVQGPAGAAGSRWFTGTTDITTGASMGDTGDYYLRTDTGDYYHQIAPGVWNLEGNLKGPQGLTGNTGNTGATGASGSKWYTGTAIPTSTAPAAAVQNDMYLRTTTGDVYQKTTASAWSNVDNITGPQGATGTTGATGTAGATWYSSAGTPSTATGVIGDWHINTSTNDYYRKTGASFWTLQGNLTGATGPTGPQGIQGLAGPGGIGGDMPALYPTGGIRQTVDRRLMTTAFSGLAAGRLQLQAIQLSAGDIISSITFGSSTTASGALTHTWFSLYDASRNLLGTTVDDTSASWPASTWKTLAMQSAYTVPTSGLYYLGITVVGTPPSLIAVLTTSGVVALSPVLQGSSTTSQSTPAAAAATAIAPTAAAGTIYAYVSGTAGDPNAQWSGLYPPASPAPASVGQSSAVGTAGTFARSDHVHGIGIAGLDISAVPSAYPNGVSNMAAAAANGVWPGGGLGNVITFRVGGSNQRTVQWFVEKAGTTWVRGETAVDVWSSWIGTANAATVTDHETRLAKLETLPYCVVDTSVAYSMANAWSIANTMTLTSYTAPSFWSATNGWFTIPTSGLYHIDASVSWAANATGRRIMVVESFTGTDPGAGSATPWIRIEAGTVAASPNTPSVAGSRDVYFASGTKVRLAHYQNSGAALNSNSANAPTYMGLRQVG